MLSNKYRLPAFLEGIVLQDAYLKWLITKSDHIRRDRKRGNTTATREEYKIEIHRAVIESNGHDDYTGEKLDWSLLGKYNNDESKTKRRAYKLSLALLPTLDHVGDGVGKPEFKICSFRTNDAKHDLTYADFVMLCRLVIQHSEKLAQIAKK